MGGRAWSVRAVAAILIWWIVSAAPACAGGAVRAVALPNAPASTADAVLLTLGGQPLLLSPGSGWILRRDLPQWRALPLTFPLPAKVSAVSAGPRGVLIDRARPVTQAIEVVALTDIDTLRHETRRLPEPLGVVQAASDGEALLIAGIAAGGMPRLLRLEPDGGWTALDPWPGGGAPAAIAAQNRARIVVLADGRLWRWTAPHGWRRGATAPGAIGGGTGFPIGQAHILYAVARDGHTALYDYSTITDAWSELGRLPIDRLAGVAVADDGLVVAARNAGRMRSWRISTDFKRQGLGTIDVAIVAVYMLSMLGMGLYFYRRTNADNAREFFLAGSRIPFWAAGLSMFAGTIGSVNYLAYPAKSFETDWQYLMSKVTYVGGLVVVAIWLAPFFRRLNVVSVYSYLEARFHVGIRLLASALWIVLQLTARMGIILYLPALAINTMTGFDIIGCIVGVGVFTIVYTALGGMRAVVWTDVIQVFVLMGGALFAIGYIFHDLGVAQVIDTTLAFDKTHAVNFSFDVKQPTIWTFVSLAVLEGILCFPRDQIVMQRVLATSSPKEASWSIMTFAAVLLPSAVIFYGIGTALFAFYRAHPAALDPLLPIDAVFPTFIGSQLPHGIVGLVVAGVLAAAMGVLSGIINSVATLLSVDFYARLRRTPPTQKAEVRFAEGMTVLVGTVGIAIAIVLSRLNIHSLLDLTIELGGVFGGSFAGAYPLGMFSTRANWQGAAIGIVVSSVVTLTAWAMQAFHPYLYLAVAISVSIVAGHIGSLFFPAPDRPLTGLTVFTPRRDQAAA